MARKFRSLRADEIDCRISQIKTNQDGKPYAVTLLLYKDARCDQNILDETVGPEFWQREHTRDNRNCKVSIWNAQIQQWVSKEDTGTESNTEKEKGLASDSFKRACFNWGIGRELYTAPYIEIKPPNCVITQNKYGKNACWDNFRVSEIVVEEGVITGLKIVNEKLKKVVFSWGKEQAKPVAEEIAHEEEEPAQKAQTAAQRAEVTAGGTIPPVQTPAPQAPAAAPKKPMSEGAKLLVAAKAKLERDIPGFDFGKARAELVASGEVENVASAVITIDQAGLLIAKMQEKYGRKAG